MFSFEQTLVHNIELCEISWYNSFTQTIQSIQAFYSICLVENQDRRSFIWLYLALYVNLIFISQKQ